MCKMDKKMAVLFRVFVLFVICLIGSLCCRLRCPRKLRITWKCEGNDLHCVFYTHPPSTKVERIDFKILNAPVDLRTLPSVGRITVERFLGVDHPMCYFVRSNHTVKVNNKVCVSEPVLF